MENSFDTMHEKTAIVSVLSKVKLFWKELVNNHQPAEVRVLSVFSRYKSFLEETQGVSGIEILYTRGVDEVEALLRQYHELSNSREKRNLINEAYVGLILGLSEYIEELSNKLEEEAVLELV